VVGDELIPLGKVKDFSPYITKVKASGAQALITGNWGPDITLLIKAGTDAGLDVKYYTLYAGTPGTPAAIGAAGDGKVFLTGAFTENLAADSGNKELTQWVADFRNNHKYDFVAAGFRTIFEFIQAGFNKAGSTDPVKFARALEGMTRTDLLGNPVTMRADDHQLLLPYYVAEFSKDGKPFDAEKTGLGWKTKEKIEAKDLALPTSCRMQRPAA
jgi:branched-chain amino acid transport system substrate-binding protein